ncbi:hypothetical protein E1B28_010154 [Marasmius oreades]|uniref:Uncharacterized protein n=1 Tax=Marasmius oreades TaxID=181124 RepID=A0A9P7UTC9_9AGAR|nr:uncharacterized protein E1B28_010154 [Marasmius oreades]KAG7091099.1 hypothetical protein E1B28_010154 [Marasmius oreades]
MPKLRLKRTLEEEAARRLRKERKAAKRRYPRDDHDERYPNCPRHHSSHETLKPFSSRKWASDDEDFIGSEPADSSSGAYTTSCYPESESYRHASKPDYEAIQAEMEEQRFREKISMAFDEDEAFDSLEARLNSFAHVPMHWGGGHSNRTQPNYDTDAFMKLDPMSLDEEDYAEWIRRGMYRKTHVQEYEEEERKKSERASRRAREKAIKAETERLGREAANDRRRRKGEKEYRKRREAIDVYHGRWKKLLSTQSDSLTTVGFNDIPWPVFPSEHDRKGSTSSCISLEDLTKDAISAFLFMSTSSTPLSDMKIEDAEKEKKDRKDKLRETFLRFHPDKFEGRFMYKVPQGDQEKVRAGLATVVRALNELVTES